MKKMMKWMICYFSVEMKKTHAMINYDVVGSKLRNCESTTWLKPGMMEPMNFPFIDIMIYFSYS